MKHFSDYIDEKVAYGRYSFEAAEALRALNISKNALSCVIYKLKKKHKIISPARNFYIIIPDEYRHLESLPAAELIPILFKHLNTPYYVCLLSSALYHGASHQKPQVFQVMSSKRLTPLLFGKIKIEFIYKKSLDKLPTQLFEVKTGYLTVATPELTVRDLFLYPNHAGGLNHIATVLSELIESIDPPKLITLIKNSPDNAWIQRLGYILENIDPVDAKKRDMLANEIYNHIKNKLAHPVPLITNFSVKEKNRNNRWRVIENSIIESDL